MLIVPLIGLVQITFAGPLPTPPLSSCVWTTISPGSQPCVKFSAPLLLNQNGARSLPSSDFAQPGCALSHPPPVRCHESTCGSALLPSRYVHVQLGFIASL